MDGNGEVAGDAIKNLVCISNILIIQVHQDDLNKELEAKKI